MKEKFEIFYFHFITFLHAVLYSIYFHLFNFISNLTKKESKINVQSHILNDYLEKNYKLWSKDKGKKKK